MNFQLIKAWNWLSSTTTTSAIRYGLAYIFSVLLILLIWQYFHIQQVALLVLSGILFIELAQSTTYLKRLLNIIIGGLTVAVLCAITNLIPHAYHIIYIYFFVLAFVAYYCQKFGVLASFISLFTVIFCILAATKTGVHYAHETFIAIDIGIVIAIISVSIFVPTPPKKNLKKANAIMKKYLLDQIKGTKNSIQKGEDRCGYQRSIIECHLNSLDLSQAATIERFTKHLDTVTNSLHQIKGNPLHKVLKSNFLTSYNQLLAYLEGDKINLEETFTTFRMSFQPLQKILPTQMPIEKRVILANASFSLQCLCLDAPEIKELIHAKY